MKRLIALLLTISVAVCMVSCKHRRTYEDGYADGYEDGSYDAYSEGYYDGVANAQQFIAFVVDDDLRSLARDIEKEYGVHPGEAVEILSNYADVPDEVTEEELYAAIWAIYRYYYSSNQVIHDIEDYWID